MADSYNKKERDKKRRKRKQDKAEKKKQRQEEGVKGAEFMYLDADGNLTTEVQDLENREEVKLEEILISTPKMEDRVANKFTKTGIVKFYDPEKRFGFIVDPKMNEEYFVHVNDLIDQIKEKDEVEFEAGMGQKGKIAMKVKLIKEKKEAAE